VLELVAVVVVLVLVFVLTLMLMLEAEIGAFSLVTVEVARVVTKLVPLLVSVDTMVVVTTGAPYRVVETVVSKVLEPEVTVSTTTVVAVGVEAGAPVPLPE